MRIILDGGVETVIDDESWPDLENKKIQKHVPSRGRSYACIRNSDGSRTYLHRYIVDAGAGEQVDHIDGDTLNNRIENLRVCTQQQNMMNSKKRSHSKQPYKGIRQFKSGKWGARLIKDGKAHYSKCRETAEEAAIDYDRMAIHHFGEFARPNFPEVENVQG